MSRLVGKKSNSVLYTGLAMLIAAAGIVALESFGVIDFAPDFGKDAEFWFRYSKSDLSPDCLPGTYNPGSV